MFSQDRERTVVFLPALFTSRVFGLQTINLCPLAGYIERLAYISTNEYRFDGGEKSVICTVSSDCTVRAWDLQEVSWPIEREGDGEIDWILTLYLGLSSYLKELLR